MNHLRLIYHHRKIAAASGADHEAAFYTSERPWSSWVSDLEWCDTFDRGSGLGPGWSQSYRGPGFGMMAGAGFFTQTSLPPDVQSFAAADRLSDVRLASPMMPTPPEGWRRVGPADCNAWGQMFYAMELAELARDHPDFQDGCRVHADYRRIDGEWFPVTESLRIEA